MLIQNSWRRERVFEAEGEGREYGLGGFKSWEELLPELIWLGTREGGRGFFITLSLKMLYVGVEKAKYCCKLVVLFIFHFIFIVASYVANGDY